MEKKIIYSLIATHEKPLADFSDYEGTFKQDCLNILKDIYINSIKAMEYEDFMIFYINENHITYMILTEKSFPNNVALQCLDSIKTEFNQTYEGGDLNSVPNFGLNNEFQEKLKTKVNYYNEYKIHEAEEIID